MTVIQKDQMWAQLGAMFERIHYTEGLYPEATLVERKAATCPWCGAPFSKAKEDGGAYAGEWFLYPESADVSQNEKAYGPGSARQIQYTGCWVLICPRCGWEGRFRQHA